MFFKAIAGGADIGKNTDLYTIAAYREAVRVATIVQLREGLYSESGYLYRFVRLEGDDPFTIYIGLTAAKGGGGDIYGNIPLAGDGAEAINMIGMLVGDEDGLYPIDGQAEALHARFCFTARDAGIYKNRLCIVTYIIAVAIAAGVERGYVKGHEKS